MSNSLYLLQQGSDSDAARAAGFGERRIGGNSAHGGKCAAGASGLNPCLIPIQTLACLGTALCCSYLEEQAELLLIRLLLTFKKHFFIIKALR